MLLGLRTRGKPGRFARWVSNPSSQHFLEQERRAGRPALGSLPPFLYEPARGPDYDSIFSDITVGTSSRQPNSAAGMTAAGGAAQPGYDLATGLGSLKAARSPMRWRRSSRRPASTPCGRSS